MTRRTYPETEARALRLPKTPSMLVRKGRRQASHKTANRPCRLVGGCTVPNRIGTRRHRAAPCGTRIGLDALIRRSWVRVPCDAPPLTRVNARSPRFVRRPIRPAPSLCLLDVCARPRAGEGRPGEGRPCSGGPITVGAERDLVEAGHRRSVAGPAGAVRQLEDRVRAVPAVGRRRGGLTTKVHPAVDGRGLPLSIVLTPGNVNDCTAFGQVLAAITVPRPGSGASSVPARSGDRRQAG